MGQGSVIHQRVAKGERAIDYRHYMLELAKKPQALRQVAPELIADLGAPFDAAWRELVDAHGPKQAARIFAKLLSFVETRGLQTVAERIKVALEKSEPLLAALAVPEPPAPTIGAQALPENMRDVTVHSASAADFNALLTAGAK